MTTTVAHLCRHPIKSAGYEEVAVVTLTAGWAFPFDREWAVAHVAARFAGQPQGWQPKLNFLRGWAAADLMAVRCVSDEAARRLTLSHPRQMTLTVFPDDPDDQLRLIDWLRPLWPDVRPDPDRVVRVPGQPMTDVPDPVVAVLNLATLREVSARAGQPLSIHRWRGNIWLDGLEPWAEFGLVGQGLRLGGAEIVIDRRITRCRATEANPDTGAFDAPTLASLSAGWGHQDFGVYARVTATGPVRPGDVVEVL